VTDSSDMNDSLMEEVLEDGESDMILVPRRYVKLSSWYNFTHR